MLLIFTTLSAHPTLASGIDCSSVPPALWCRNANLSAECGFAEHCKRFLKASNNKPVHLTVFYESLCPYCQGFITRHLYPEVYRKYSKYVDIELIPYGNAQRTENGRIVCHHGPRECATNRFEGCAIHYLKDPLPFVFCLELGVYDEMDQAIAAGKCFKQADVPPAVIQQILKCNSTEEGDALQQLAAERTHDVGPDAFVRGVPYLLFNNISLKSEQSRQRHMRETICDFYVGDILPDFCIGAH